MKIILDRMKFFAHHGVLPQEQMVGAYFYVSIIAETDKENATENDELRDTVSYADIAQVVKDEMQITSKLLEHVTMRIAKRLKHDFPTLQNVTVKVMKENPPMGIECKGAGVEITL